MTVPAEQQAVAGFLAALSGNALHETHISAVFVGKDTVWKLKKAVRLPFLDFTTSDARQHFLRRELELNQPHAPGIYRDVVPIGRRADGSLALQEGEPVDWVLRMAPVPAANFLDSIARRGGMTPALLDQLGDSVAACHARLAPVQPWDHAERQEAIALGNADAARAAGLPRPRVDAWLGQILSLTGSLRPWLQHRVSEGFIRRCHGDLHLGNLCLWNGVPVPFDALEFNEDMATIDTGYDLAFLLMDLDRLVGRAAANRVMNRYIARTGDADIVAGLPLFMSQRAMIRAHVLAATAQQSRDAEQS